MLHDPPGASVLTGRVRLLSSPLEEAVMRFMFVAVVLALISADCSIVLRYPPSRSWTESVETLGAVTFCRGGFCDGSDEGLQWPIAFKTAPQAEAHYAEL